MKIQVEQVKVMKIKIYEICLLVRIILFHIYKFSSKIQYKYYIGNLHQVLIKYSTVYIIEYINNNKYDSNLKVLFFYLGFILYINIQLLIL